MTRRETLKCVHEPFGDAFYYGPERLSSRFEKDEKARVDSGFSESTFQSIFDDIESQATEVRLLPPTLAASLPVLELLHYCPFLVGCVFKERLNKVSFLNPGTCTCP